MKPELYGHPFASFVWKPLIALYEREVEFSFRIVDGAHADNHARIVQISPIGQFPILIDGTRHVVESNAVIEYLDLYHGTAPPLIPVEPQIALEFRMMADVFDDYVHNPMQKIVGDALRSKAQSDEFGVADAHAKLERTYEWLERRLSERRCLQSNDFTIADCAAAAALFYAHWVHPINAEYSTLAAYRAKLLSRPSVARVVDEARPYREFFPLGAPDQD